MTLNERPSRTFPEHIVQLEKQGEMRALKEINLNADCVLNHIRPNSTNCIDYFKSQSFNQINIVSSSHSGLSKAIRNMSRRLN